MKNKTKWNILKWGLGLSVVIMVGLLTLLSWAVYEITVGILHLDWSNGMKGVVEGFWYGKDIK